jgi:response regulator RpfG family c-di-GMP phosphodiesterase
VYKVPDRQLTAYQLCYEIECHLRALLRTYNFERALKIKYPTYKDIVYVASKITLVVDAGTVEKLLRVNTIREKVTRMLNVSEEEVAILEDCRDSLPKVPKVKRVMK